MTQPSPYFIRKNPEVMVEPFEAPFRRSIHDEDERTLDLLQYWITVKKHRWLILAMGAAATIIVGLRVSMLTPLYTAQSTIMLKPGTPEVLENRGGVQGGPESYDDPDTFIKTQCEILKSRTLAAYVIEQIGLEHDPNFVGKKTKPGPLKTLLKRIGDSLLGPRQSPKAPSVDDTRSQATAAGLTGAYLGALQIRPVTDTDLVNIVFTTANAQLSAKLATAHAHAYIREGI